MDRMMVYPGQIPLETDLLNTNRFSMIGLGKLTAAVLGTGTLVNGLGCTPSSPASMQVQIWPGEIYTSAGLNVDSSAYSSLAIDTHALVKQGLLMDAVSLTCTAPTASGQSVVYLVQASYQDTDTNAITLPYYNASNPAQGFSGPNNDGSAQATVRRGVCFISLKAGAAAPTGSQSTPSAADGCVGLYAVTVSSGQTSISASNIAPIPNAPFITETLTQKISQATADLRYANLASPALTGSPTAPTPAQFDSGINIATTGFVQRSLGNVRGVVTLTGATTLTAAQAGNLIVCSGTPNYTVTLPAPAQAGLTFYINAWQGSSALTLSTPSGGFAVNGNGSNTMQVNGVQFITCIADSLNWVTVFSVIQTAEAGNVSFFARSTPPQGWLKANGAAISRSVYASLFGAIGTQFNLSTDTDNTLFRLPDLRGEFLRGFDDGRGADTDRTLGSSQSWAIQNITGTFEGNSNDGNGGKTGAFYNTGSGFSGGDGAVGGALIGFNAARVVQTSTETRPRNIALLACIKY